MPKIPEIPINAALSLPLIGLGTWELRGKKCEEVVREALDIGYRHIDTAFLYENHEAIGEAIKSMPREEIYITSKFFASRLEGRSVEASCDQALKELKTDYLDIYLLHYPEREEPMEKILQELQRLEEKGKVKAAGVSNFTIGHLKDMLEAGIPLKVNQVEFHPFLFQQALWQFCNEHKIRLISFRTLGKGKLSQDPTLIKMGAKYKKSPSQILLRWCIEKKIPVIPKASTREHLEENLALFDFALTEDDTQILDTLEMQKRFCDTSWGDFDY